MKSLMIASVAILGLTAPATANGIRGVEADVAAALAAEKQGFNARDCDAALGYRSHGPLEIRGHRAVRARKRSAIAARCARVRETLPPDTDNGNAGAKTVRVLSRNSGYTITEYPDGAVVTKYWQRAGRGWRLVRVRESFAGKPLMAKNRPQ